jgi:hypothetical protein
MHVYMFRLKQKTTASYNLPIIVPKREMVGVIYA